MQLAGRKGSFAASRIFSFSPFIIRALATVSLRGDRVAPLKCLGRKGCRNMERQEIERIRDKVSCGVVLEQAGFQADLKESTRRAVKFRRGGQIAIVTHAGMGWFDPLSDRKGGVFGLQAWLQPDDFAATLRSVGALAGVQASGAAWPVLSRPTESIAIPRRWDSRPPLRHGSPAYRYFNDSRLIPSRLLQRAIRQGLIREGPYGSAWLGHHDSDGKICGWEERGPRWRGFSSGGTKILFRFGSPAALRLCITEATIDALSLAAIECERFDTLYASTAGGWSPATELAVRDLGGHRDPRCSDRSQQPGRGLCRHVAAHCGASGLRLPATSSATGGLEQGSGRKRCGLLAERLTSHAPQLCCH
ncbi:DUF3991 domain-containing protein [Rhizobium sp. PL01]|uniref:DUF3991 domain-containing protein n=1 Tax=Rhizobium sp. PL01 TaxID=3085631 RepID=UPI002980A9B5|nr:DUF3991 domain-containing protein [Rhizobium sp. PL01]MDW5318557.1 DUF3991 domain-containing protein [Rhizobium sp. PL01]